MSPVTCPGSHVTCHMSRVACPLFHLIFSIKFFSSHSGGASRRRVCYQRGLPRLVSLSPPHKIMLLVLPGRTGYFLVPHINPT